MANAFQQSAFQHPGFQGGGPSARVLAELYGGNIFTAKKKKKKEEKSTIEDMVREVALDPEGKQELVAALPERLRADYPDVQMALVADLVRDFERGTKALQAKLEAIYRQHEEDDDEEDDLLLMAI